VLAGHWQPCILLKADLKIMMSLIYVFSALLMAAAHYTLCDEASVDEAAMAVSREGSWLLANYKPLAGLLLCGIVVFAWRIVWSVLERQAKEYAAEELQARKRAAKEKQAMECIVKEKQAEIRVAYWDKLFEREEVNNSALWMHEPSAFTYGVPDAAELLAAEQAAKDAAVAVVSPSSMDVEGRPVTPVTPRHDEFRTKLGELQIMQKEAAKNYIMCHPDKRAKIDELKRKLGEDYPEYANEIKAKDAAEQAAKDAAEQAAKDAAAAVTSNIQKEDGEISDAEMEDGELSPTDLRFDEFFTKYTDINQKKRQLEEEYPEFSRDMARFEARCRRI
jgi:hypothetical protein